MRQTSSESPSTSRNRPPLSSNIKQNIRRAIDAESNHSLVLQSARNERLDARATHTRYYIRNNFSIYLPRVERNGRVLSAFPVSKLACLEFVFLGLGGLPLSVATTTATRK